MTTTPARPASVWQLAASTGAPLEDVIFQAVAYGAWQPLGVVSAEWADSLMSILHSSTPWHRQGPPNVNATESMELKSESDAEFAGRVVANLGSPIEIGDPESANTAARSGLGQCDGDTFTGHADAAAEWAHLAGGQMTLNELIAERGPNA